MFRLQFRKNNKNCQLPTSEKKSWDFLKAGDQIDILHPSAKPPAFDDETKFNQICEAVENKIKSHDLLPNMHKAEIDPSKTLGKYYANTPENCAHYFQETIENLNCKAIWLGTGGFGAINALNFLEHQGHFKFPKKPVPICGFSDHTYFHLWASREKQPSLHSICTFRNSETAPITHSAVNQYQSMDSLIKCLKGETRTVEYEFDIINLNTAGASTILNTKIVGGNFASINRSRGTSLELKPEPPYTLFIEDTSEVYNRLDTLLTCFAMSPLLYNANCLMVGALPVKDLDGWTIRDALHRVAQECDVKIPIIYSDQFGHGDKNEVLPLGTETTCRFFGNKACISASVNQSAYNR